MKLFEKISSITWKKLLTPEFEKPYFQQLEYFLEKEYETKIIFPDKENIFAALHFCDFDAIKVVILGQDPYHGKGQAQGLSFSVPDGFKIPPSLVNIFKEMSSDLGCEIPKNGNLESWAIQGVLLLNTTLSVEESKPNSHQNQGWEKLTDQIIRLISLNHQNIVFILWGTPAQKKEILIDSQKHLILKSAHPSPLSVYRGFWGCKHFSLANEYLIKNNKKSIIWDIK